MDADRIRSWLKLPDGAWPPDHYTLLGLPPGCPDIGLIELRVLERMEVVRRYQLPHPETATEAMNRLAQALDCLGDGQARRQYDTSLGLPSAGSTTVTPAVMAEPPPHDLQPLEPDEPPPWAVVLELPPDEPALTPPEPTPEPQPEPPSPRAAEQAADRAARRLVVARLVRARRCLRAWQAGGEFLADPERRLVRRTDAAEVMGKLTEIGRQSIDAEEWVGGAGQPGGLVVALARQPLNVHTFRALLPSQREALARDWTAGRVVLSDECRRLRSQLGAGRSKRRFARGWSRLRRKLAAHPEWAFLVLGASALAVAAVRG
jgi:hypothetical protein